MHTGSKASKRGAEGISCMPLSHTEMAYNSTASLSEMLLHSSGYEDQAFKLNGLKKSTERNHFANHTLSSSS